MGNFNCLKLARQVLDIEISGLNELKEQLGEDFALLVEKIYNSSLKDGRVVVTGVGKSGHIGLKIAATLSSTGTSAVFVHSTEASHGDLGIIKDQDIVLALSNSGETTELNDIINYCRRFNIYLVSFCRNKASILPKMANLAINVPPSKEACSLALAPSTSSTQMLALGDALAICLLEKRGFSSQDFHKFHPGGKLGRQLNLVAQFMHVGDCLPLVSKEQSLALAIECMSIKSFGCTGVTDKDGKLIGIITDGDIRRILQSINKNSLALKENNSVEMFMSKEPKTVQKDNLVVDALNMMEKYKITSLFVVDEHKIPVGIIHIHDCLKLGAV